MTMTDVINLLRDECRQEGSQMAWAAANGVSDAYVSDVLLGRRDPGQSILEGLGLEKVVTYAPIAKEGA
ncbi:MAG TPA: hypothetical protein ENH55_10480 [Aurantimonas coralicida]|uniref:Uncharacterized protein n=2 Tax=root TaxID=1 RepID=A0A9C9NHX6_9HYPH|nr:hypothetical protein [Aurantimonas coralicida]HEU01811.1 hypothetical protein [Aurantimonas coralicida]